MQRDGYFFAKIWLHLQFPELSVKQQENITLNASAKPYLPLNLDGASQAKRGPECGAVGGVFSVPVESWAP